MPQPAAKLTKTQSDEGKFPKGEQEEIGWVLIWYLTSLKNL